MDLENPLAKTSTKKDSELNSKDPYTNQLNQISLFYNDRAQNAGLIPETIYSSNYARSPYINTKFFYQAQIARLSKSLQVIQENLTSPIRDTYSLQQYLEINLPILTGYTFDIAELLDDATSFSKQDSINTQTPVRTGNRAILSKRDTIELVNSNELKTDTQNLSGKVEPSFHIKNSTSLILKNSTSYKDPSFLSQPLNTYQHMESKHQIAHGSTDPGPTLTTYALPKKDSFTTEAISTSSTYTLPTTSFLLLATAPEFQPIKTSSNLSTKAQSFNLDYTIFPFLPTTASLFKLTSRSLQTHSTVVSRKSDEKSTTIKTPTIASITKNCRSVNSTISSSQNQSLDKTSKFLL
jgi:hypothetical protein